MRFGADFSALIERFCSNSDRPIALAVSGGSDSLALLLLSHAWAEELARPLVIFTVDHGLRAAAKQEIEHVATLCKTLGRPHKTLVWAHPKPSQAAARSARYDLLSAAARAAGAACLMTGHTFDDVIETALIRRRRGVRDATLAGPVIAAPVPSWPAGRGVTLVRPVVQTRRTALRGFLRAADQSWCDDPSNQNPTFERSRIRASLERHPGLARIAGAFTARLQQDRAALDAAFAHQLRRVRVSQDGLIDTGEAEPSLRLLAMLARCASGGAQDPRSRAVAQLVKTLEKPGDRQTLGGAWFQRTARGYLIGRDPARITLSTSTGVFDGRFASEGRLGAGEPPPNAYLVRHAQPPGSGWNQIISERIEHLAQCAETPACDPVETV